jgi:hypothetical protein
MRRNEMSEDGMERMMQPPACRLVVFGCLVAVGCVLDTGTVTGAQQAGEKESRNRSGQEQGKNNQAAALNSHRKRCGNYGAQMAPF